MIDFSKIKIEEDESLVDEKGNPRKDAEIYDGFLKVHPSMRSHLEEALRLFFNNKNNNTL